MESRSVQSETVPKVSVCVTTYNQEKYINQCLQSLIDQQTNFSFEILVADDCSTDGTRSIIQEFAENYSKIIKPIFHKKNLGASRNFIFVHDQAQGHYIAHMDGDDYALPGKLQAQADFLDKHKNCNLLWTPVLVETAPGIIHEQNAYFKKYALSRKYTRADLIRYGTVGTNSSKMYRRSAKQNIESDFDPIDYLVNAIQVGDGIACFTGNIPYGVYRAGIGIASAGNTTTLLTLRSIRFLAERFPECRVDCNVAALVRLLSAVKNRKGTLSESALLFFQTFHWHSFFIMIKEMKFMKSLNVKNNHG